MKHQPCFGTLCLLQVVPSSMFSSCINEAVACMRAMDATLLHFLHKWLTQIYCSYAQFRKTIVCCKKLKPWLLARADPRMYYHPISTLPPFPNSSQMGLASPCPHYKIGLDFCFAPQVAQGHKLRKDRLVSELGTCEWMSKLRVWLAIWWLGCYRNYADRKERYQMSLSITRSNNISNHSVTPSLKLCIIHRSSSDKEVEGRGEGAPLG